MTNVDILLVQLSWQKVLPIKDKVVESFYLKLFELDPALRPLFSGDLEQHGARLIPLITAAVRALDQLDALRPAVRDFGMRHLADGIRDEDYGTAAIAWLWTLEHALGAAFTPEVKSAWIKTYGVLSQTMREAGIAPEAA